MRFFKKIFFIGAVGIIALMIILLVNFHIDSKSGPYIFSDINSMPSVQAALVLGAKVYQNGTLSGMLEDRAAAAVDLYESGKAEKILVSGDHGGKNYDEVNAVKDYLMERGVSEEDIFLDHAGFDTYDSLYRAKEVFKARSVIAVTQNFHLPRAVYIGNSLGIETYGLSADRHLYANIGYNKLREILSKAKAFLDVNFHSKPKFLGDPILVTGDGRKSWD